VDEDVQDFVYTSPVYIGISIITHEEKKVFIVFRLPWRFLFFHPVNIVLC